MLHENPQPPRAFWNVLGGAWRALSEKLARDRFLRNALLCALLLHVIAAILSAGWYHTDEHFQILEFLNFKLGLTPASALPLEFGQQIRPWFQPALYLALLQPLIAIGDRNPLHWVLSIRLFSALIGWLSLCGLALLSERWIVNPKLRRIAILLCATLYFLPAFHARHSSENLSGSVFYIAFSILFLGESRLLKASSLQKILCGLGLGLLFGASFEIRYQVGFLVAGVYAYWLFFRVGRVGRASRPGQFSFLTAMVTGTLLMIGLGTAIDHWGYGAWTFAPWNYFHYNLILNHVSDVDIHPAWDFFRTSFTETFPPLGTIILCSAVLTWISKPLHPITWGTFPLFLIHTIIGHKELRFLFPIAHAAPLLVVMYLDSDGLLYRHVGSRFKNFNPKYWLPPLKFCWRILYAINLIALAACTFLPVWMPARFYEQAYPLAEGYAKLNILYKDKDPYEILGIPLYFYRPQNLTEEHINSFDELQKRIDLRGQTGQSAEPIWFFQVGDELPADSGRLAQECQLEIGSLPPWLTALIRIPSLHWATHRITNWTLYRCTK
jgi:phosphatidylinositol glycan class B